MTEAPRRHVNREWCLHRGVRRFVRRCVPEPYLFANHDRAEKSSEFAHIWEKERGALAGFPDTTLWVPRLVFPCELKWPGNEPSGAQAHVGAKLTDMGHPWNWADSVIGYGQCAWNAGVPLLANWETVAAHEDELVAADVRKQETRTPGKSRRPWPAPGRRGGITSGMLVGVR